MSREPRDYYPTTPELCEVVRQFADTPEGAYLHRFDWLDLCAGQAALTRWCGLSVTHALEFDDRHLPTLHSLGLRVIQGDVLTTPLPGMALLSNPPFSLLDPILEIVHAHVETHAVPAVVLVRETLLTVKGRASRRARLPHYELRCCWRPSFTANAKGDFAASEWLVYLPGPAPTMVQTLYAEAPPVPMDRKIQHARMAAMAVGPDAHPAAAVQPGLRLEPAPLMTRMDMGL